VRLRICSRLSDTFVTQNQAHLARGLAPTGRGALAVTESGRVSGCRGIA
jgi:hypothetical protein